LNANEGSAMPDRRTETTRRRENVNGERPILHPCKELDEQIMRLNMLWRQGNSSALKNAHDAPELEVLRLTIRAMRRTNG
jgi:hypothetical protein